MDGPAILKLRRATTVDDSLLAQAGREPLYIGVWSENFGAERLYARHGFQRVGEYLFPVGEHRDLEFILKRSGVN